MENDPELQAKGKFLGTITADFARASDVLRDTSDAIRDHAHSAHPIFVFAREPVSLGALLLSGPDRLMQWHIFASSLEEFTQRGLVQEGEGEADFRAAYKDPDEYACLFVVDPEFMEFVFLPYPED